MSEIAFDHAEYQASFHVEADRHEIVHNARVITFEPSYLTVSISPSTTVVEVFGRRYYPVGNATGSQMSTKFYLDTDADRMTAPDYVRKAAAEAQRRFDHANATTAESDEDEPECEGHESLAGAHMGESVFCDGTCVSRKATVVNRGAW